MNIPIEKIDKIYEEKQKLLKLPVKTLEKVAHKFYIPESKINKEELINNILYRKYMELLLCLDNNCFGYIRRYLTYKDDINLMLTCKTLQKKIRRNNYWCDLYKVMNRINIKSNPNFIPKKIKQINKLFNHNGHLEYNNKIITIILVNLLSKVKSLYKVKKKKQIFIVIINFTLERQQFLRNNLDFAHIVYDKILEYENNPLLTDFIIEAKNKFLKLGVSLE
jgi:hypothetical protein